MHAQRAVTWVGRDLVAPDGARISYRELEEDAPWVRVVADGRGTTYALFSFPEGDERERYVLVSPGRHGRVTFYRNRQDQRFDYVAPTGTVAFDAGMTPTDVAMLIQQRFAPIPA